MSVMFPDPTLIWKPYPSALDGIERPPYVFDNGIWRGTLHLIVLEPPSGSRAYGIKMRCEIYAAFNEMIHSIANHGGQTGFYDGNVYIKEAENSQLLRSFEKLYPVPLKRSLRHFLFVGGDRCYETLGFEEPVVQAFSNKDDAYAWRAGPNT